MPSMPHATVPARSPAVLVVQSDAVVGLAMEIDLEARGIGPTVAFGNGSQARGWLEGETPAAAVLDWSHGDRSCLPLARLLRARGVPFLVHSEAARRHAEPELGEAPWYEKPEPTDTMARALAEMLPLAA